MALKFDVNVVLVITGFFSQNRSIGLHFVSNNKSNPKGKQVHIEHYITSTRHRSLTLNIDGFVAIILSFTNNSIFLRNDRLM